MKLSIDRVEHRSIFAPYAIISTQYIFNNHLNGRWIIEYDHHEDHEDYLDMLSRIIRDFEQGRFGMTKAYTWTNRPYKKGQQNFNCRKL